MVRGVERRDVFLDDRDRRSFLRRLSDVLPEAKLLCFAWVLMPNHIHLVVRTGEVPLGRAMARVGTGYAMYFNRRYGRVGHLVQNRFKSRLVTSDDDFVNLIRYVHLNPLRAGIVKSLTDLRRHPWSGHSGLMGARPQTFHSWMKALALFGDELEEARRRLEEFMRAGLDESTRASESARDRLEPLVDEVCLSVGIVRSDLTRGRGRRQVSDARSIIAYRATLELGLARAAIAEVIGVSASATSRCIQRGRDLCRASSGSSD